MKPGIIVMGWYLEQREDGRGQQIVIIPPSDGDPDDVMEHVARTPQELWAAFEEIARNPMPDTHTEGADGEYEDEEHMQAASDDVGGLAVEAAQAFVTNACGPVLGRLAGGIIRNPGGAMEFLRSISRKDRR